MLNGNFQIAEGTQSSNKIKISEAENGSQLTWITSTDFVTML
jgi:hypothetical protein